PSQPAGKPTPAISSRSLMAIGHTNSRLERGGIRVFKSTIEPFSHKNARWVLELQGYDWPTTCVRELIANASLEQSPSKAPRSMATPFFQRYASEAPLGKPALPTISPPSVM